MNTRRALLSVAVFVSLAGCMTQAELLGEVEGRENGLLVWSVRSVDEAWLIPGKGLVIVGTVVWGGEFDQSYASRQPRTAAFATALSLRELRNRAPLRLSYERFHAAGDVDQSCPGSLTGVRSVSVSAGAGVELVNPPDVSPRGLRLEEQLIRVGPISGVTSAARDVALGPRGGEPAMLIFWPFAFLTDLGNLGLGLGEDVVSLVAGGDEGAAVPGDPCAEFAEALFPTVDGPEAPTSAERSEPTEPVSSAR